MRTLALLLCLAAPAAAAQGADHLIGQPYAGLPGGWGPLGGIAVDTPGDSASFGMSLFRQVHRDESWVEFEDQNEWLVIYTRLAYRALGRYPVSTVLAALQIELQPGEAVVWPDCSYDRYLVAVAGKALDADGDGYGEWGPVRLAWELDTEAAAFQPIDTTGLVCEPVLLDP